jgi:CxxC-x17-CxxC domain-containing protein
MSIDTGRINKNVLCLAKTDFRGSNRVFGIKRVDRRQHMYVVGKTGTGKSAMMHNMIIQDIANGEGLCVVDPHGELIEGILDKIPEDRMKDVIYFNPADVDYHIGFNILELPDPKYKHLVASGLMGIFTKIWANVWSARMEYILNNALLALLDTPGSTLLGVPRLLVDKEYRQRIIANIADPVVKAFWVNEYEQWQEKFRNEAIAPIQNKVGQFLSTALIRNIVGQSKSTIDIFDIMNTKKIFLVNVSKGRIGEDSSALLGAMLITKIQLAAMERVRIVEEDREDFYLYVDEFQNFATDSFSSILSEARKYRLNLIIAHQYIGQLVTEMSTKVRDSVFGNVGTMMVFRVGAADAEFLEPEFEPEFMIPDIVNLPNFRVCVKLMVDGVTCRPFSAATIPPFTLKSPENSAETIVTESRNRYGRSREEVEREINRWSGIMYDEPLPSAPARSGAGASSFSSGGSSSGGWSAGSGASSGGGAGEPMKYPAICSNCGKKITLPFEPTPGRPVYCKTCFAKIKESGLPPGAPHLQDAVTEDRRAGTERREPAPSAPIASGPRRAEQYSSDLAGMGIEFEERSEGAAEDNDFTPIAAPAPAQPVHIPTFRPAPPAQSHAPRPTPSAPVPVATTTAPRATLSLSSLKPEKEASKPKPHSRPEVNIDALRDAISKSLGKTSESSDQK